MNINATLLGQTIMFAMFVWFCMKFVWPPIMAALEARKKHIADGLAAAERGKHDLDLAAKRAAEVLREAKEKAAEIITQGDKRAAEIIDEAKAKAEVEAGNVMTRANSEIEQEVFRAKEQLRTEVSSVALAGAGKILGREIDARAHNDLLEKLIAEI